MSRALKWKVGTALFISTLVAFLSQLPLPSGVILAVNLTAPWVGFAANMYWVEES